MTSILKKYLILTLHGNFSVIPLALMMCLSTFSEASGVNSISESSLEIPPCSIAVAGTDPPVISCGNPPGTVALMATSYGLYSNLKHYWYTAAVGGSELDGSPVTTIKTPGYDAYYSTINVSNVTSTVSYWVATCVDGDRDEVKITVNPSPIVDINTNGVTPYNVCPGSGFTISCTTSSSSYQWYKDGTAILNATAADYMPEVDGNYKVKIIDATCGELPSSIIPVTIVDYTATPIINPVGLQIIANSIGTQSISVNLTGTGYTYQWKKDGVDIAGETNATYIANSDGSYTVDVWYGGCLKTSQALNLHINLLPIAIAGIDIALVLPDELNVTLDGSSSYDPDGTIASYSWSEVSNKNVIIDASNTATPRLSNFTGEGIYEFSLTVTDDLGESASDNIIITASIIPNNYNWVKETVVLTKDVKNEADLTANAKSIKWDYFDGLGRPMQSVSVENSRTGKDIITPIVYDEFGRQSLNYLPFVSTAEDGLYKTNAIDPVTYTSSDQYDFYTNATTNLQNGKVAKDTRPFSETIFEPSPLNRVNQQYGPGQGWKQTDNEKPISYRYEINTTSDNARLWTLNKGFPVCDNAYYTAGELYKNVTVDEENHEVQEFIDKMGSVVLKRVEAGKVSNGFAVSNYSQSWNYSVFASGSAGGVGSVSVSITENVMTINFSAGFTSSTLAVGKVVQLNTSQVLPNMILGQLDRGDYQISIEDGWLTVNGTSSIDGFNKSFEVDLGYDKTWADTYYIYDDFRNLRFVLPPEAMNQIALGNLGEVPAGYTLLENDYTVTSTTGKFVYLPGVTVTIPPPITLIPTLIIKPYGITPSFLDKWAFQYQYDGRNRMVEKQVPGAGEVYMVYDDRDRLVLTQDANQREENKWIFTKYDQLNRPIITGEKVILGDLISIRDAVKAHAIFYETFDANGLVKYTPNTYPTGVTEAEILSVTYYDNHNFTSLVFSDPPVGRFTTDADNQKIIPSVFASVKGQVTGSKTKILGTVNDYIETVNFYDDRYRLIQSKVINQNNGNEVITTQYDFVGRVRKTYLEHDNPLGNVTNTSIAREFFYDHAGRLLTVTHQLNGTGSPITLVKNEYNELGELVDKKLHYTNTTTFEQSVDYRYNIRGWLTSINDAALSAETTEADLFGMELAYNTIMGTLNAGVDQLAYNGNISAIKWSGDSDTEQLGYGYTYDEMNRLKKADYQLVGIGNPDNFDVTISDGSTSGYDLNGNIKSLTRNTTGGAEMDNLSYTYIGNQLQTVTDTGDITKGFKDGNTTGSDYWYDANGNMTVDLNKGIASIEYNHLNLPSKVTKDDGQYIKYIYDAAGIKLSQIVYDDNDVEQKRTDYIGEFIYEAEGSNPSALAIIQHEEGRIVPNSVTGDFEYQYHLKDHLGNTRLTFTTAPKTHEFTLNYEQDPDNPDDYDLDPLESNFAEVTFSATGDFNSTSGTYTDSTPYSHSQILYSSPNSQIGSVLAIQVGKGDIINASVNAKYIGNTANGSVVAQTLASALVGAFTGSTTGNTEGGTTTINNNFGSESLIGTVDFAYDDPNAPHAFLNVMFLPDDDAIDLVKSTTFAYDQITDGFTETVIDGVSQSPFDVLSVPNFEVKANGYLLVYVSNEGSLNDVHFDDMLVTITESKIIQKDDYYPFGLQFNSWARATNKENKFLYNGKEMQNELDLGLYDYGQRLQDPTTGRFNRIDRFASKYFSLTPYGYVNNDPIRNIDINGDSINVSNLLTSTEGLYALFYMVSDMQDITGLNISVNGSRNLTSDGKVNKDSNGNSLGSGKARNYFNGIMGDSKENITVENNNSTGTKGWGTGRVNINTDQIDNNITAANNAGIGELTFGYGMSFLHETLHTRSGTFTVNSNATSIIGDGTTSTDPIGATATKINSFRNELGLYERSEYHWSTTAVGIVPATMKWSKGGSSVNLTETQMTNSLKALRRGEAIMRKRRVK